MNKYRIIQIIELRDGVPVSERYEIQKRFLFFLWIFEHYVKTYQDAIKFIEVANSRKETIRHVLD